MRKAILNYVWFVAEGFMGLAIIWGLCALISGISGWIIGHWLIFGWLCVFIAMVLGTIAAKNAVAGVGFGIVALVIYALAALGIYLVGVKLFDWISWVPSLPFRNLWAGLGYAALMTWLFFKIGQDPKSEPTVA